MLNDNSYILLSRIKIRKLYIDYIKELQRIHKINSSKNFIKRIFYPEKIIKNNFYDSSTRIMTILSDVLLYNSRDILLKIIERTERYEQDGPLGYDSGVDRWIMYKSLPKISKESDLIQLYDRLADMYYNKKYELIYVTGYIDVPLNETHLEDYYTKFN